MRSKSHWPTLGFAGLLSISLASSGLAAMLAQNGQPRAVIVIPAGQKKSPPAADLQSYLEKVSGAKLPILPEDKLGEVPNMTTRVFVGPCQAAVRVVDLEKLQPEGFVIKTERNDLFIVGRDKTEAGLQVDGTFYGVCEFLERYAGIRWILPGPLGEVVPKRATIELASADIRQEPPLWQRRIRNSKQAGHRDRVQDILKSWGVSLDEWEATFSHAQTSPWFSHQRLGARVKLAYGHSFMGWWDKYHQQYPDIFAMQPNGSRVNTGTREQMCVSNPGFWDLVAQDRIKELRANPDLTAASISANDGGVNKFCSCERCRAWDAPDVRALYRKNPTVVQGPETPLTDRYCRFYNEVARRVKQEMPDRYLGCYAYSLYRTPPVAVQQLEDNLIVGYVGFGTYLSDARRRQSREEWQQWSKVARQLILRPNLLWGPFGLPINYTHKLAEDLRFLADHGMHVTDYDGGIGNWGTQGLDYYVLARLLWDPYRDVEPIVEDYCRAAYGPGAPAMKDFYRRLEQLTDHIAALPNQDALAQKGGEPNQLTDHYSDAVLAELQGCVNRAVEAIGASDPAALARARLVSTGLDYTKQTRRLLSAAADVRAQKSTRDAFEKVQTEVINYYRTLGLSWSVAIEHDFSYIRNGLNLRPRQQQAMDPDGQ